MTQQYKLSKTEMETIINFNEGESMARIYTFNHKLLRKLEKYAECYPQNCKLLTNYGDGSYEYEVPKKKLSVNFLGDFKSREMTEEEKEVARQRMIKMHEDRKAKLKAEKES